MCITQFNPSEPCCDDPLKRCNKCPKTDWSQFTWRFEQPVADLAVALQPGTVDQYWLDLFPDASLFIARYAATEFLMKLSDSPCLWTGGPLREVLPATLAEWSAAIDSTELASPEFVSLPLVYPVHSNSAILQNVRVGNRFEFRVGWECVTGVNVPPGYNESFPDGGTLPDEFTQVNYLPRERFNCEGSTVFDRDDESLDQVGFPYPGLFPELITVTRVVGQGEPVLASFTNGPFLLSWGSL